MDDHERKQLEETVRELEEYLEGLARGGAGRQAVPRDRPDEELEEEIAQTRRDIEELKKRLASA